MYQRIRRRRRTRGNLSFTVPFSMTGHLFGFSSIADEQRYGTSGGAVQAFDTDVSGSGHVPLVLSQVPPTPGVPPV